MKKQVSAVVLGVGLMSFMSSPSQAKLAIKVYDLSNPSVAVILVMKERLAKLEAELKNSKQEAVTPQEAAQQIKDIDKLSAAAKDALLYR